ncbi:MAG TPA: YbhB/YbcL family Raf kinase inhibitor-like protein [Methanolinea sp.]|jgi:hypothetical protein|nr:YbhB/YbcL family Raf kinase inhibitor-like protein [Methanolinea sp.]MDI6898745.1 YbhB/YbcL family Raf kinase inhibitor-like protein [Methanolinea sp.]HOS82463.1 YbhB/YbcL family Raf kinase inhibitor-like protein [Methanolinea sp.]HPC55721.1 YbhB/YbcL family Raf kinase inhibitor-like protein [Methanolinea sp.]HQE85997.1 YbhB/YbcL family Raf kinase inhibitor-like protein [Methanolinea sp.]
MEKLDVSLGFLEFPPVHTCDGEDLSPLIRIGNPRGQFLALMAINPFIPSCCSFSTWIAWNIPVTGIIPSGIPRDPVVSDPVSAVQGTNDWGTIGYRGPCPRPGTTHRVTFKVWALDGPVPVPPGSRKADLVAGMRGHVLAYGDTMALYSR